MAGGRHSLVRVANGAWSVRSHEFGETMHPGGGPVIEAERLYVEQLGLRERLGRDPGGLVVWDVGLGAAGNAMAVVRSLQGSKGAVRLISFDHMLDPLEFGLAHAAELGFYAGYETVVAELIREHRVRFRTEGLQVAWEVRVDDFPSLLRSPAAQSLPRPDAILYDPFSPSRNPAMWTLPVFRGLYNSATGTERSEGKSQGLLLATYSRSTLVRTALLLAGFFVGVGCSAVAKEETTLASDRLDNLERPLGTAWLERAHRSGSAEPLSGPEYRQRRLSEASWQALLAHPQFSGAGSAGLLRDEAKAL